jgi:ADP-ribosylglycohydrolase
MGDEMSISDNIQNARLSLEGLSVGDGFGEKFFLHPDVVESLINSRALPGEPWYYTDDTQMALSIVSVLSECGEINQDKLAQSFARRYDSSRGYGAGIGRLLTLIRDGEYWGDVARNLFDGQGSYGNGAAMRVAPLGAYFADDIEMVVNETHKSAVVTHTHSEAIAGAVAVAVAAALALKLQKNLPSKSEFLNQILPYLPDSEVRSKIRIARDLTEGLAVQSAASILGNGTKISAQDTVPFALWCAAQNLGNYEEALWLTVNGLGDRDTTCAIVGGIVVLSAGFESIPNIWLKARENLPDLSEK